MRFDLPEIAAAVDGSIYGPPAEVNGASIDSRSIKQDQLFVPIVAERDGHEFIAAALNNGASAYLTERTPTVGSAVVVASTPMALLRLGQQARAKLEVPTIAVTGSVGKTSVKDLTAAALSKSMQVHASPRSFNNDLGLPLTLLNAPETTELLVLEIGARGLGQVAKLCEVALPTIGIVTSVAMAHTELFGSVDEVARGKAELIEALPKNGTAVLNADDSRVIAMKNMTQAEILTFGQTDADVRVENAKLDEHLCPHFHLATPWGHVEIQLQVAGLHNATNAAAATAAGLAAGASLDSLAAGLETAHLSPSRMAVTKLDSNAILIDDAYNANPTSMRAALEALSEVSRSQKIAVLGLMAELGSEERSAHLQIAEFAAANQIQVIAVATDLYGIDPIENWQEAANMIMPLNPDSAVLVKGSLVAGLQALAERLKT